MDTGRNDLLGEIAADAALERSDFLVQATEQLRKFLDRHKERIASVGGLTLIDEDPDYLAIAPDLTFRSRTPLPRRPDRRVGQRDRGHRDRLRARRALQPGRHLRGLRRGRPRGRRTRRRADGDDDLLDAAGIGADETVARLGDDPYAAAADDWAAGQPRAARASTTTSAAARRLYDLALEYQERSQRTEARLLERVRGRGGEPDRVVGDLIIVDDDDERLTLDRVGRVPGRGPPEEESEWRPLDRPGRARRVLRPDRRLRRPGRRARRGVSRRSRRSSPRDDAATAPTATPRTATPTPTTTTTPTPTTTPTDDADDEDAERRRARRADRPP